jgi:hypothetical protein
VHDLIGFRHAIGGPAGGSTNIYLVFRLDVQSDEPRFDNDEIIGANFFSFEEMSRMERPPQGLSTWAIRLALSLPPAAGFHPDVGSEWFTGRLGYRLFGRRLD